jgi:hypothetical protein
MSTRLGCQLHACVQADAKRKLGTKGLAILLQPAEAQLEPFGEFVCRVSCLNDMVGTYIDTLRCAVGDLKIEPVLLRIGVVGSPVHVQTAAHYVPGLHHTILREASLAFGHVPRGVAVVKHFSVFNTACFGIAVAFRVRMFQKDPTRRWLAVSLDVAGDGTVSVPMRCASLVCACSSTYRLVCLVPLITFYSFSCFMGCHAFIDCPASA